MRAAWIAAAGLLVLSGLARAQGAPPAAEPPPADAPAPYAVTLPEGRGGVPGTWDLSRDGTNRRCVLTLAAESGEAGQKVRFPAGCRRSVPVVGAVAGWLFADGVVRLVDRNVRPVLIFAKRPDARSYVAKGEESESYSLVPLDIAAMRPAGLLDPAPLAASPVLGAPDPVPAAAPAANPGSASLGSGSLGSGSLGSANSDSISGVYALDRFHARDVCRVDLGGGPGALVRILPGCHDSGIEVFDPATWRAAAGRMTLVAKRGHVVELVPTGDGAWRRDPETGVTFVLRRVGP